MVYKGMAVKKIFLLLLFVLLFRGTAGCNHADKEDVVSEQATKVIETMLTCPNQDLFNMDMFTVIGTDIPVSNEHNEKAKLANEKALKNWEDAIGDCFAEGYLEQFLSTGLPTKYLAESETTGATISIVEIQLDEKTETSEWVTVNLTVDDENESLKLVFYYDGDGLISKIEEK